MKTLGNLGKSIFKYGLIRGVDLLIWLSATWPVKWWCKNNPLYQNRMDYDDAIEKITNRVVDNYHSMFGNESKVETESLGWGITRKVFNQLGLLRIVLGHYATDSLTATKTLHNLHLESMIGDLEKKILARGKETRTFSNTLFDKLEKMEADQKEFASLEDGAGNIDTVRYLASYYAREISADYNPEFFWIFRHLARFTFVKNVFKHRVVTYDAPGLMARIKTLTDEHPVAFVSNHVSNMDHVPIIFALTQHHIYQPSIVAGKNLDHGFSSMVFPRANVRWLHRGIMVPPDEVKKSQWLTMLMNQPGQQSLTGLWKEISEQGVGWANNPIYRETDKAYTHVQFDYKQPILFYIGGGRSNTGELRKPKVVILKDMIDYVKLTKKPIFLCPTTLSYTAVGEDEGLEAVRRGEKNISEGDLISQLVKLNAMTSSDSPIYTHFSEPIKIEYEHLSDSPKEYIGQVAAYADQIMETIGKGVKNTATYLLAASMIHNNYDAEFTYKDAKADIMALASQLEGNIDASDIERRLITGIRVFKVKGFIEERDDGSYRIINGPLIRQYANRIAHKIHLE